MTRALLLLIVCLLSAPLSAQVTLLGGPTLPGACIPGQLFVTTGTIAMSLCTALNTWTSIATTAGGAAWGGISGTLADQTDLNTALGDKLAVTGNGGSLTGLTQTQVGLANVENTADANKPISTATQTALNGKQASGTYATGTGSASGTNTGDQTITLTGAVTGSGTGSIATTYAGIVPFAQGGRAGSAATSATTGTMTVNMTTAIVSITPTGACTFNASGGVVGQIVTFIITTAGTTSFTLTWGTNFRKTGTLATGTVSARFFAVTFVNVNGTLWQELARTIVQT